MKKYYSVRKFINPTPGKGIVDSIPWDMADSLVDFNYPWEKNEKPPLLEFKALHDQNWLYIFFSVTDHGIKVYRSKNEKREVLYGDRVEIFFAEDHTLSNYYCLEIDPYGRLYDYEASFYRKFNDRWSWPAKEILTKANLCDSGYEVKISLSLQSLTKFGLLHDDKVLAGIFRGKCTEINLEKDTMRWISWADPDSSVPDFHDPSSFGHLLLEEYLTSFELGFKD